jgi:hypothetical protein
MGPDCNIGGRVVYALDNLKVWVDLGAKKSPPIQASAPSSPRSATWLSPRAMRMAEPIGRADACTQRCRQHTDPMPKSSSNSSTRFPAISLLAMRRTSWPIPFSALSKTPRVRPIDFRMGGITNRVEATPDHGKATIWDADVLIWAASQIVEAPDAGLRTSRLTAATPYEILSFVRRGTSVRGTI